MIFFWISSFQNSANCSLNPLFGQMYFLLDFTKSLVAWNPVPCFLMKQAIVKLALLEMPAAQWIRIFLPWLFISYIQLQWSSKCCLMGCLVKSSISQSLYSYLGSPLNGWSRCSPHEQMAVIPCSASTSSVVAASSLPRQTPSSTQSISGSFCLIDLQYLASAACLLQHSWQMAVYSEQILMFSLVWHSQQVFIIFSSIILPRVNYYYPRKNTLIIFITIMSKLSSLEVEKIDSIAEKQYKLYDLDLFKSQLKVFQGEVEGRNEESVMQEEFFPITHEEKSQQHNHLAVHHSFQGMNEESIIESKKALVEAQEKEKAGVYEEQRKEVEQESGDIKAVEAWENRPRKCSNPRFLENSNNNKNENQTNSQLVQQLQILSKERAKYRQANYFSKKERSIAVKSIEDLFQSYKDNAHYQSTKEGVVKLETPRSNQINAYLVPSSPLSKISNKNQAKEQIQKEKECELCEKTKQRVQMHKFWKAGKQLTPKLAKEQSQPEKWQVGTQPRIKRVNPSPSTSPVKYFANQQKSQYTSELSSSAFRGQVPLKEEYFQQNRLRDEYLKNAKQRSQEIQKQLQKLKYPRQLGENGSRQSSSRKKIFALSPAHRPALQSPKIEEKIKPIEPPQAAKPSDSKPPVHRSIFSSKISKDGLTPSKRTNHSLSFKYEKQALINTRIHIFNSKEKLQSSKQKSGKKSKCKIFNKPKSPQKPVSPRKNQIIHNFNVLEFSYQTRQWLQKHEKEILSQADKIYSYELITRYISQNEIQVRLGQFVKGMIEPKRWILLMVDSVYARLKDRYLPA